MRIAILGGGVAGVVLAHELARTPSFTVSLYERSRSLGGLHRSVEIAGAHYDIGAFLFDAEHALLKTFPSLYDHFVPIDHRALVVTQHHTLDAYPMTMRGYLRDNGAVSLMKDVASLLSAKIRDRRRDSLCAYLHYYLGKRVYRQSGLKAYIERFYAVPDTDVDLEFARQRLSSLPDECGLRSNVTRIVRDALDSRVAEKTWHCYVRPREGFSHVYAMIEAELRSNGVEICAGAAIERIERDRGAYLLHMRDGASEHHDLVISTIPVGAAMRLVGRSMDAPPESMTMISLCYRFNGDIGFERANMLYNFTYDGLWKRLTLFSSLYGLDGGDHYFTVECTQRRDDNRSDEEQRRDFEQHVARLPLFRGELKYQGSITTDNAYPFFRRNDLTRIERARRVLSEYGIALAGRQGEFSYLNAHETAMRARALARQIETDRAESFA